MFLKNATLFLVSCFIVLMISEVCLRIFFPQHIQLQSKNTYVPDSIAGYKLASNYNGYIGNRVEYMTTITTNSYGIRHPDLSTQKQHPRILILGDSFVFGQGVEQNQTVSAKLEDELRKKGKSVTVINAGVPGYGTVQEANWLKHHGLKLKPDILLVGVFMGNDLKDNGTPINIRSTINGSAGTGKQEWYRPITDYLYNNIHLYGLIHNVQEGMGNSKRIKGMRNDIYLAHQRYNAITTQQRKLELKQTQVAIVELKKITELNNIRLIIFLIPAAVQVEPWRQAKVKELAGENNDFDFTYPNSVFLELGAKYKLNTIDLTDTFKKSSQLKSPLYYPIDGHWNESGHSLAAKTIAGHI